MEKWWRNPNLIILLLPRCISFPLSSRWFNIGSPKEIIDVLYAFFWSLRSSILANSHLQQHYMKVVVFLFHLLLFFCVIAPLFLKLVNYWIILLTYQILASNPQMHGKGLCILKQELLVVCSNCNNFAFF